MKEQETTQKKKMSRTKKWLFAGGAVLIFGILFFVFGMCALDWDFYRLDKTKYTAREFAPAADAAPVTRVELDIDSFPVTVTAGETLSLSYYETSDGKVEITQQDGVLTVRENFSFHLLKNSWFNFGRVKKKYALTVPAGVALTLKGSNGDITVSDLQNFSLSVDCTNVDLTFYRCNFAAFDVKSVNADIELHACSGESAQIRATNLDFEASDSTFATLGVSGTNTDADIERCDVSFLTVHGTNLDADILLTGAKEEYTVETRGKGLPAAQTGTTDKKISLSGTNCDVKLRFAAA